MRQRVFVGFLIGLLLASGFSLAAEKAQPGAEFIALMQKILDAWATLDSAQVAPFYAQEPDRVFYDILPLKYTGWAEYARGFAQSIPPLYKSAKFTLSPDARAQRRGSFAWGIATVRADFVRKDGTPEAFDARWSVVWEKRGKDWVIVHDHFSVPMPALEDPSRLSLYKRLGGYDAIAAVVDDFIGRLVADRQVSRFFTGASTDSKKRIRQLVVDQLCAATGGPCIYTGRSMKASHEGLGITESDWQVAVGHLLATLEKFKVPQKEKDEVVGAIAGFKAEIVARR